MTGRFPLARLAAALLDLVLPAQCAGCQLLGTPWCPGCAAQAAAGCFAAARHTRPTPCPPGLPPLVARGEYAGALRRALVAYKDEGRHDLLRVLAPLLAESVLRAAPTPLPATGLVLVPMPSSPRAVRARGAATTTVLARAAAALLVPSPVVAPALRLTRRVADQSRLGSRARAVNLAGAYAVPPRAAALLSGRVVVLVDDVVTTGATLAEGARALAQAGAHPAAAAVVAATALRLPRSGRGASDAGASTEGTAWWPGPRRGTTVEASAETPGR